MAANKPLLPPVDDGMAEQIRFEADGAADLARTRSWLSRHRGESVELERDRQVELGVPIAGAGAVLVAVTVQDGEAGAPQLGGVMRAIASRGEREPVRLVFEGRSPALLARDEAQAVAVDVLALISRLIEEEEV